MKGRSGNPSGRPKTRRPHNSAFDIIFDKTLTVRQGSLEREITIAEALEFQTYQAALSGNKPAIRTVLKMIEKRERALRLAAPPPPPIARPFKFSNATKSADEAMRLLNIICSNPDWPGPNSSRPQVVETWAAQAAISRPGRPRFSARDRESMHLFIKDFDSLRWPKVRG